MQVARRLYLYAMSAISLGALSFGASLVLRVLLANLGLPAGVDIPGFGEPDLADQLRADLAVGAAVALVATPIWLGHWLVAQRFHARDAADRASPVRAVYFTLVLLVLLATFAGAAAELVRQAIAPLAGGATDADADIAGLVGSLIVTGALWAYHVTVRVRDLDRWSRAGAAAWLPRAYRYIAAVAALFAVLVATSDLVQLGVEALLGSEAVGGDAERLAEGVATVAVAAPIWAGHWAWSGAIRAGSGWQGASERPARLRLAAFIAVIVGGAIGVVAFLATAGRALLAVPLDAVQATGTTGDVLRATVVPAVAVIPFAAAWLLHTRWMRDEASATGPDRRRDVDRLDEYAVTAVGLATASLGIGWLLGLGVDTILGGSRAQEATTRGDLALAAPLAVIGLAVWAWRWRAVRARYAAAPTLEAGSATRRSWLLLVIGVALVGLLISLATFLYRLLAELIGVTRVGDLVEELSTPAGALIAATAVLAYHAVLLQRDGRRATAPPRDGVVAVEPPPPERPAGGVVSWVGRPVSFVGDLPVMRLHAPDGGPLVAALAHVRASWASAGPTEMLVAWLAPDADGPWSGGLALTDDPDAGRALLAELVGRLPELAELGLDEARVERGVLRSVAEDDRYRVEGAADGISVVATWGEFRDRRVIHVPAMPLGDEVADLTAVIVPCGSAGLVIDGRPVPGEVRPTVGDDRAQSGAYLALAMTLSGRRPAGGAS